MRTLTIASLLTLLACGASDEPKDTDTQAAGQTTYREAGDDEAASHPEDTPMWVEIRFDGTGDLSLSDVECDLTSAGAVEGLYSGEAQIDGDGLYVASFSETEAELVTPSGCEVPEASIDVVTGVVVRGELEATEQNCEQYCAASASSEAEAECAGDSNEAECEAAFEQKYAASCTQSCTAETTHVIVAETALSASALADLAVGELTGAALGTIQADLTFDHIEDSDGETVDEAP